MRNKDTAPLFYSFRRCPYAMRARLAITASQTKCQLREIILRNKPAEMLEISPKGTVPVLQLPDGRVIEESIEVMHYALSQSDPHKWLWQNAEEEDAIKTLIHHNDGAFKSALDRYKYTNRYEGVDHITEREKCRLFLQILQDHLAANGQLCARRETIADWAIMPFIRQCRIADPKWFDALALPNLHTWLNTMMDSGLFTSIMEKYPAWQTDDPVTYFPEIKP